MSSEKVAVVTGANKGLGLAIVQGLCEKFKGTVYLTSRDETRGQEAIKKLHKVGLNASYHQLDITDDASVIKFTHFIKTKHSQIDLLINNAGILFLKDTTEPRFYQAEQTINVNFFSLVMFTEAILPIVKNGGKIINISSSSGHLSRIPSSDLRRTIGGIDSVEDLKTLMNGYLDAVKNGKDIENGWGESSYVVSKISVNAYTFILHRRLICKGISVNCVHPGYVRSDMTRGAGSISPQVGATAPLRVALSECAGTRTSGLYVWHDGTIVPWDGADPRIFIDGRKPDN